MQPHIERVFTSERLSSSHAPDIFYELVFGRISTSPGQPPKDAVLMRMVRGEQPMDGVPVEIHVNDIAEVQDGFVEFLDRVRRKIDPGAAPYRSSTVVMPPAASAHTEPISGRYAPDAPRKRVGSSSQPIISSGPRKAEIIEGQITPRAILRPGQAEPEPPKERPLDETYHIISYNLSSPPSADALMRQVDELPELLVVIARFDLVQKVEDYLVKAAEAGGRAVPTSDFVTVVINREHKKRNPAAMGKTRAALAGGLQRMLGLPKAVLWIPPEA